MRCFCAEPNVFLPFLSLQMLCHCSLRSAVIVVGVKNASLTPRSSWRSWRKSMQPASSSPKTREGASRPPPTSQSVKSPSGSKTDESRRKNLSANPRAITCTPLDKISDLLVKLQLVPSKTSCHILTSCIENRGWRTFWPSFFSSFFFFYLSSIISIDHMPPRPLFSI